MRRLSPGAAALCLAIGFLAGPGTTALPRDEDLARRTFANAELLMKEGKAEQALRDFSQVVSAYPASSVADDALFRMGTYYYPVETVDALGSVPATSLARARDLFSTINARYPKEDRAPAALYRLGLIALDPSNPRRNLDEAYASFTGVVNIYPASESVAPALLGAGFADFIARRYDKSIASFDRVAEEFGRSPAGEDARYYMGLAYLRLGAHVRALQEFQEVRNIHPQGRLARRALDRNTLIYKLKVKPGISSQPLFAHDASYKPALDPRQPRGDLTIAVDADSVLHALDPRSGSLLRLGHDGRLSSTGTAPAGAASVAVDEAGAEVVAAGDRVRAGTETIVPQRSDSGQVRPYERITAAVRVGPEEIALLDEQRNEILLYSGDPARLAPLYRDPAGRARLSGLAVGVEGKLYTIDRRSRRILEVARGAAPREIAAAIPGGDPQAEPSAIAADDVGGLYVLYNRSRAIVVMTAEGKPLQTITSQPGAPADFGDATSIAAGPRGEIYVHDAKSRTILRFW